MQNVIALFTTESEYIAIIKATKEAIWLKDLIFEIGLLKGEVVVFF